MNIIPKHLKPGHWIIMKYGSKRRKFYVHKVTESGVYLGRRQWCVSDTTFVYFDNLKDLEYIGQGKKLWYWPLLPFKDLVCPYSEPK